MSSRHKRSFIARAALFGLLFGAPA